MKLMSLRRVAVFALFPFLSGCGSSNPTPVVTASPTPFPVPTPAPSPTPLAFVCPLPARPDLHIECPKIDPKLSAYVNTAIENVIAQQPQLFDFNNNLGAGSWKVLDRQKYVDAVVRAIQAQGICAKDDNEEIAVKNTNDFHEQYNIWTSGGYVRRAYITTCIPAQF
jgi:hypothetical protein